MEDIRILSLVNNLEMAIQGLEAIIEESAELSPARKIAEKTLEEIKK